MKKKLLALVCALALTVSLVGCALSTPDTVGKVGDDKRVEHVIFQPCRCIRFQKCNV